MKAGAHRLRSLGMALGAVGLVALASPPSTRGFELDQEYYNQWGLAAIDAARAYALLEARGLPNGGEGVTVAVSDTGVDFEHPELRHAKGGYAPKRDYSDDHGTMVAGVIAAARDGDGVHGAAFNALIVAISEDSPRQHLEAARRGAGVINMSWSTQDRREIRQLHEALAAATTEHDSVLVASLGQDDENGHNYPVGFADDPALAGALIVVGSIDQDGELESFGCGRRSHARVAYCLVAPGDDVLGAMAEGVEPGGGRRVVIDGEPLLRDSGSSFSTAFVSGAAAVIRAARPDLSAGEVVEILLTTATRMHAPGEDPDALSPSFGWGALNLGAAVEEALRR